MKLLTELSAIMELYQKSARKGVFEVMSRSYMQNARGIQVKMIKARGETIDLEAFYKATLEYFRRKKSEYHLLVVLDKGAVVGGIEITLYHPMSSKAFSDNLTKEQEEWLKGKSMAMAHNHPDSFKPGISLENYKDNAISSNQDEGEYSNAEGWCEYLGAKFLGGIVIAKYSAYMTHPKPVMYVSSNIPEGWTQALANEGFPIIGADPSNREKAEGTLSADALRKLGIALDEEMLYTLDISGENIEEEIHGKKAQEYPLVFQQGPEEVRFPYRTDTAAGIILSSRQKAGQKGAFVVAFVDPSRKVDKPTKTYGSLAQNIRRIKFVAKELIEFGKGFRGFLYIERNATLFISNKGIEKFMLK